MANDDIDSKIHQGTSPQSNGRDVSNYAQSTSWGFNSSGRISNHMSPRESKVCINDIGELIVMYKF